MLFTHKRLETREEGSVRRIHRVKIEEQQGQSNSNCEGTAKEEAGSQKKTNSKKKRLETNGNGREHLSQINGL